MKKTLFLWMIMYAATVQASEYGCKVLLCLANPASNGGPKGVTECVQPVNQLFRDLSEGKPFPACDASDGNDGSSFARLVNDPYDPCPMGLQAVNPNTYVVQGQKTANGYAVTGTPKISQAMNMDDPGYNQSRACVGAMLGRYSVGGDNSYMVNVYQQVVWQMPQSSSAIDVYINNAFFQRVRF